MKKCQPFCNENIWRTQVLFMGTLIPLFWTSNDVWSGFQSQGWSIAWVHLNVETIDKWANVSPSDPMKNPWMSNIHNMIDFLFTSVDAFKQNIKVQVCSVHISQENKPDTPQGLIHETLTLSLLLFTFALRCPDRRARDFQCYVLSHSFKLSHWRITN